MGRKWATLDYPSWAPNKADIETGRLWTREGIGGGTFYTPESWAAKEAADAARETIKAHGLSGVYGPKWPDERVALLAAWLEAVR